MKLFQPLDHRQAIEPRVVEQAMLWAVTLQSGTSDPAEQAACKAWRQAATEHELAWQRIMGLTQDLRSGATTLPARHTRQLLKTRSAGSRRALLKGFAGFGILAASGWGAHERVLLPELFSDYHTSTGERRRVQLGSLNLQLDTQTLVDIQNADNQQQITLIRGRLMLDIGAHQPMAIRTADGWIRPAPGTQLIVGHKLGEASHTLVQVLSGSAVLQPVHGQLIGLTSHLQAHFDARRAAQARDLPASASAWTSGLLIAERTMLGEVIAELDRYRRGVLRCDPAIAALQVSGSLSLDRPDASLDLLSRTLPIRVNRVLGYWASVVPA